MIDKSSIEVRNGNFAKPMLPAVFFGWFVKDISKQLKII